MEVRFRLKVRRLLSITSVSNLRLLTSWVSRKTDLSVTGATSFPLNTYPLFTVIPLFCYDNFY